MPWVVKIPKRYDFCGCPPCPLCYVWADAPRVSIAQPAKKRKPKVVDGITKMMRDLRRSVRRKLTEKEKKDIKDAAEKIHVENLARPKKIEEEFKDADFFKATNMTMSFFLKEERLKITRPAPKPLNRVNCDDVLTKAEKAKQLKAIKEKAKTASEEEKVQLRKEYLKVQAMVAR